MIEKIAPASTTRADILKPSCRIIACRQMSAISRTTQQSRMFSTDHNTSEGK